MKVLVVILGLLLLIHTATTMWAYHMSQDEMQRIFKYMRQICRNTTIDPAERYECEQ